MNFKKRSEMCGPEVKEQEGCGVLIGHIAAGTVFSGRPKGYSHGVFLKLGFNVHYEDTNGAARLCYTDTGETTGFVFMNDHEIQDYKELNATLVDEDA